MEAPVEPAQGVSGLYFAASVFVPLALWFGIFVGILATFSHIPMDIFLIVLFRWVFGDSIVLTTIGTTLMVTLTSVIQRSHAYVKDSFS